MIIDVDQDWENHSGRTGFDVGILNEEMFIISPARSFSLGTAKELPFYQYKNLLQDKVVEATLFFYFYYFRGCISKL